MLLERVRRGTSSVLESPRVRKIAPVVLAFVLVVRFGEAGKAFEFRAICCFRITNLSVLPTARSAILPLLRERCARESRASAGAQGGLRAVRITVEVGVGPSLF